MAWTVTEEQGEGGTLVQIRTERDCVIVYMLYEVCSGVYEVRCMVLH